MATETRLNVNRDLQIAYPKQFHKGTTALLKINEHYIPKNLKESIQKALYGEQLDTYIINKYKWAKETFAYIGWVSHESALKTKKGVSKTTIIKLLHKWQSTNQYVQRNERKPSATALCSEFKQQDDQIHYLVCKSEYYKDARINVWKSFCKHI